MESMDKVLSLSVCDLKLTYELRSALSLGSTRINFVPARPVRFDFQVGGYCMAYCLVFTLSQLVGGLKATRAVQATKSGNHFFIPDNVCREFAKIIPWLPNGEDIMLSRNPCSGQCSQGRSSVFPQIRKR